jgi:hypothetical protein
MTAGLTNYDPPFLRLLALAPFERRARGWRFGTKTVADHVVARLVASGAARIEGDWLIRTNGASK